MSRRIAFTVAAVALAIGGLLGTQSSANAGIGVGCNATCLIQQTSSAAQNIIPGPEDLPPVARADAIVQQAVELVFGIRLPTPPLAEDSGPGFSLTRE